MTFTVDHLQSLFCSQLRREGAAPGKHDVLFRGGVYHVLFDGENAEIQAPRVVTESAVRPETLKATEYQIEEAAE